VPQTIFKNAMLLDADGGALIGPCNVLVEDSLVAYITTSPIRRKGAAVHDIKGKTLMPGLCDAHVHVTAATPDFAALRHWPASYITARASEILRGMLMRGFTTVRDVAGADYGLAQAVDEGYIVGPRILFCGKALSQTGGHGDMRGPGEQGFSECLCGAGSWRRAALPRRLTGSVTCSSRPRKSQPLSTRRKPPAFMSRRMPTAPKR
jgi:imidazolonepropionase-like amidohydrolase